MRKVFMMVLSVCMTALLFTVPVMANEVPVVVESSYEQIAPRNEPTQIYTRWHNGRLQFRVWGVSSMRWLTDWLYF
jgi:hypothetical protein